MATFYFHCLSTHEVLVDRRGSEFENLSDARGRAFQIIQAFITSQGPEDWRDWSVRVSNRGGEELLSVPFASVLGRLH